MPVEAVLPWCPPQSPVLVAEPGMDERWARMEQPVSMDNAGGYSAFYYLAVGMAKLAVGLNKSLFFFCLHSSSKILMEPGKPAKAICSLTNKQIKPKKKGNKYIHNKNKKKLVWSKLFGKHNNRNPLFILFSMPGETKSTIEYERIFILLGLMIRNSMYWFSCFHNSHFLYSSNWCFHAAVSLKLFPNHLFLLIFTGAVSTALACKCFHMTFLNNLLDEVGCNLFRSSFHQLKKYFISFAHPIFLEMIFKFKNNLCSPFYDLDILFLCYNHIENVDKTLQIKLALLPAVDMQKFQPGSWCYLSPRVIQPSFDEQSLCRLHSDCAKTSTDTNRWNLDDSLAGAFCILASENPSISQSKSIRTAQLLLTTPITEA
ncbi:hypothetical protein VP01_1450g1 [Puccinia sorghi]|uniref:Uncharacterized protein n=1 Tax=Puccinia sorghi TaxID=27349 RepID=A0A0L6VK72_9BASI|nr:hypothetical protein VP01_1450g1 [Puccinia sorghi]